jgi:hypothetical protein
MKQKISKQLEAALIEKIELLSQEDEYMKSLRQSQAPFGSSSIEDASPNGQLGTTVPKFFGAMDTFIANPSNVGIGILARMIETDPTVMSSVQFKSLMMLSKIGEYQHENDEIEDMIRDMISTMDTPTFKQAMEGMSSAHAYGFSVSEKIYGLNKKNQKVVKKIKTYHPSTLVFEVDPYGDITEDGIVQFTIQYGQLSNPNVYFPSFQNGFNVKNPFTTPNDRILPYRMPFIGNYGLARIPRDKCIHHTNTSMLSFGSPYGKSNVRTAHLAWQLKVFFLKQLGIAGKRQASPFIWATAPQASNQVKVAQPDGSVKQMNPVEALTSIMADRENDDSIVTGPEEMGYKIQAITAQMDLNQYLAVLNWLDTQIFRGFLLPSLVMTDGSAGSRSLGDKHFQIVDRIAEEESQVFAQTLVNQMVRGVIIENFGEQDNYGHFAQRPQNLEERERLANMFATLSNAGFMKAYDQVDGDYVRSTLHLPDQEPSFYSDPLPNFPPIDSEDDPTEPAPHDEKGGADKQKDDSNG